MSGALSAVGSGLNSAATFLAGAPVQLGPFRFLAFEVPERIQSGGAQANKLHKLPGGARVMDVTGPDDAPVTWSGTFLGGSAKRRARLLDGLRVAGQPMTLLWGSTSLRVVLTDCRLDEGFNQIRYSVTCERVPLPPPPDASVKESLLDQIGDALGVSGLTAQIGAASDALATAQDDLQRIGAVLPGVPGLAAVSAGLGTVAGIATAAASTASAGLTVIGGATTALGLTSTVSAAGVAAGGSAVGALAGSGVQTINAL
jgi:hypothetical protein